MFKCLSALLCAVFLAPLISHAQAVHTSSRSGDLQVGAGYVMGPSEYIPSTRGFAAYADFDPIPHFGAEFVIHQTGSTGNDHSYERTYEIGARYFRTYGPAVPYAKIMAGRGVFNFPGQYLGNNTYGPSVANLAYNIYAPGAGVDLKVHPRIDLRADYEYQVWSSFPGYSFHPQLITIGVAYHFPGDLRLKRH